MTHQEFVEKLMSRHQNLPAVTLLVLDCCARCFREQAGMSPESIKTYFEHAADFSLNALETSRLEISQLPTVEALLNRSARVEALRAQENKIIRLDNVIRDRRVA